MKEKDYVKINKLKEEHLKLMDARNMHNATLNGLMDRMKFEQNRFDEFREDWENRVKRQEEVIKNAEKRITEIEKRLNVAQTKKIDDAHERVGHEQCQYCFQWFNKNGLASHERHCGMNPDIQEEKPEKAKEKIDNIIENGETEELTQDQMDMLIQAKMAIDKRIKALKEQTQEIEEDLKENGGDLS